MKSFEKEIAQRVRIQTLKAIVVAVFVTITFVLKVRLHGNIESVDDMDLFILIGLFMGGEVSSIRAILKYRKVLKNSEALEELHIRETDERNRIITLKTCRSTMNLTCILLSFAGIVASFFSLTVLLTIGVILIVLLGIYGVLALYYSRKF